MIGVDEVGRGCLAGPLLVVAAEAEEERVIHEQSDAHEPLAEESKAQKAEAEAEAKAEQPQTDVEKLEAQPVERAEAKSPATPQNKE